MSDTAIVVDGVSKMYRLYAKETDRVFDLLGVRLPWWCPAYQEFWALRDIHLRAIRGERLGIIGRNGAGKSTLLKIVAGTLTPSEGTIALRGSVQALMELGTGFHPDFTGRENVLAALAYQGVTGRAAELKLREISEFSELDEFIEQPLKAYSAGMYARLAFSVATAIEPEILIVDEILGAGDAYFAGRSVERMKQLTEDANATVLFVSHDLASVQRLCPRVVWLDRGRVVLDGDALTVCKAYAAAIREQEELRLRAKNLGLSRKALSAIGSLKRDQLIGHLVARGGGVPRGRHAIQRVALCSRERCLWEIRVGDAMDNDVDQLAYVITSPGYINWSEPVRVQGRYCRYFENKGGRYLHAAFAFSVSAVERLPYDAVLEITAQPDPDEDLVVELYDGGSYVGVGTILAAADGNWRTFRFQVPDALLAKFGDRHPDGDGDTEAASREIPADTAEQERPLSADRGPVNPVIPAAQVTNAGSADSEGNHVIGGSALLAHGKTASETRVANLFPSSVSIRDCYGSGEIELVGVELLDREGRARAVFTPGDTLVIRLRYRVRIAVVDPVFVVAIYRLDGVVVNQSISSRDGVRFGAIDGPGYVDIRFEPLLIGRGRYVISTAIFPALDLLDRYGHDPYSLHDRRYEFSVEQPLDCGLELGLVCHPVGWRQVAEPQHIPEGPGAGAETR